MRPVAIALLCFGCNAVFGLEKTTANDPRLDAAYGFDEDGDFVDNLDDNCPGVYNQQNADDDGDKVGEICDPHRGRAGDHIAFEEYFNGLTHSMTTDAATSWQLADGRLQTSSGFGTLSQTWPAGVTVEIGVRIEAYHLDPELRLYIVSGGRMGLCNLVPPGGDARFNQVYVGKPGMQETYFLGFEPEPGRTMTMRYSPDTGICTVNAIDFPSPGIVAEGTSSIAIMANHLDVSVTYVLLYDVP